MGSPAIRRGSLEVIFGPMFSGKTEELIRRLREASASCELVLAVKPRLDARAPSSEIVSHAGSRFRAATACDADDLALLARGAAVIGVDEAQFFDMGLLPALDALRATGRRVIVAGLDLDFLKRPFGPMPSLIEAADLADRRWALCELCGSPAAFTQRLYGKRPATTHAPVIEIGGFGLYEPRCESCHGADRT
jgi:thymidine kinase